MNLDKVVCHCLGITNGMIKDAVEAGAKTLEDVQEQTGASTVCGACLEDVQRLVDFFVSEEVKLVYTGQLCSHLGMFIRMRGLLGAL